MSASTMLGNGRDGRQRAGASGWLKGGGLGALLVSLVLAFPAISSAEENVGASAHITVKHEYSYAKVAAHGVPIQVTVDRAGYVTMVLLVHGTYGVGPETRVTFSGAGTKTVHLKIWRNQASKILKSGRVRLLVGVLADGAEQPGFTLTR
jgi:hypothetical protein